MTKSDLISALSADTGLTKADADRFLKSFTSTLENTLKRGDSLTLIGFGTFSVSNRAARTGRPATSGASRPIGLQASPPAARAGALTLLARNHVGDPDAGSLGSIAGVGRCRVTRADPPSGSALLPWEAPNVKTR